jgi:hypothetical protein
MVRFHLVPALVACVGLSSLVGCRSEKGVSVEGYWSGAITCGDAGGVAMAFDVESGDDSDEYEATGLITSLSIADEPSDVEIDAIWTREKATGPQVLEMDSNCTVVQEGAEFELPCETFDVIGWDGANTLEASIRNFLESDLDCDLELQRQ